MSEMLLQSIEGGVATLTLNRPDSRNALTVELRMMLVEALQRCAENAAVGAVVITGAGQQFCAGGDVRSLKEAGSLTAAERRESMRQAHRLPALVAAMPQIVIAAVNGAAAGAGLGLACACDLRVASTTAKFGTAFVKMALAGDYGISWTLTQIVGNAKARELLLMGDLIDAAQALHIGLVSRVVEPAQWQAEVQALATRFARGPRLAQTLLKKNLAAAASSTFQEMLDLEAEHQVTAMMSQDHREAVAAFLAKREPVFQGQ